MHPRRGSCLERPPAVGFARHAAAPREESVVSVAEAALQQQLVVPGQLLPPSERPAGVEELSVPPTVILPTQHSYAQATTTSP